MDRLLFKLSLAGWASALISYPVSSLIEVLPIRRWDEWGYADEFRLQYGWSEYYRSHHHLWKANLLWEEMDEPERQRALNMYDKPIVLSKRFLLYNKSKAFSK